MDRVTVFGGEKALLIKVRNIPEVVASKGAVASLAQKAAPETIEAKVYEEMGKQLKDKLRENKVDADVTIVNPASYAPAASNTVRNLAVGLGVVGLGFGLLSLVRR